MTSLSNASNATSKPETGTVILTAGDIERTLKRLAHELIEANQGADGLVLLGIVTRGKALAARLAEIIKTSEGHSVPVGYLDITLYRDDTGQTFKPASASLVPDDLTGRKVVLVDDVLFSGRSVRAALDALNGYGRPSAVQLLVLLDRGHRELPIRPDFVGKSLQTSKEERVSVRLNEVDGCDEAILHR